MALPGESGPVTAVAAGYDFSLAVTSSGQLYAFGDGSEGQLGSTELTGYDNPTPTVISLLAGSMTAVRVAAGSAHSMVIGSGSTASPMLTVSLSGSGSGTVSADA